MVSIATNLRKNIDAFHELELLLSCCAVATKRSQQKDPSDGETIIHLLQFHPIDWPHFVQMTGKHKVQALVMEIFSLPTVNSYIPIRYLTV